MTDNVVLFEGDGLNPVTGQPFPSVLEGITSWVKLDGFANSEKVEHNGIVTRTVYEQCTPGVAVEVYAFGVIGHSWPSHYAVPIPQIIWDFFTAHPKP